MRSAPVVAAPASPPNRCENCGNLLQDTYLARHVCAGCGAPQAVSATETYFTALGVPQRFAQDAAVLQKRFYEISRALHPDRFTTADSLQKQRSLERMSFLNDAYRTLRDPVALRDYVLELHGLKVDGARGQIPMELAEGWFELQDAIADDPAGAAERIRSFQNELSNYRARSDEKLKSLEAELDRLDRAEEAYREGLAKLSHAVQELSYLRSLARDVARMGERRSAVGE